MIMEHLNYENSIMESFRLLSNSEDNSCFSHPLFLPETKNAKQRIDETAKYYLHLACMRSLQSMSHISDHPTALRTTKTQPHQQHHSTKHTR